MKLAIFTHVGHYKAGDAYFGYAPYIREMNLWLKWVEKVEVVGPLNNSCVPQIEIPYEHPRLVFREIPSLNFLTLPGVLRSLLKMPLIIFVIFKTMKRADHIHLRCPGNIGLLACFIQMFFPGKPKTAKYAGNWDPNSRQPWSYRLQKKILSNTFLTRKMRVLVYGEWPEPSPNLRPFFTASFSEAERMQVRKEFTSPFKFLFVGNLVEGKQPGLALDLVDKLCKSGMEAELHFYGDGDLRPLLEEKAAGGDYVCFHGNQPLEALKEAYESAHFLVLVSKSEGWPKAVAEAMFFGCIPIASPVSCLPWMLGEGRRGILLPASDTTEDQERELEVAVREILELVDKPNEMALKSQASQEWSQQYTLERFEREIRKLLGKNWQQKN